MWTQALTWYSIVVRSFGRSSLFSTKKAIIEMVRVREECREKWREIEVKQKRLQVVHENHKYQVAEILEKVNEQISRVEHLHQESGPSFVGDVETPSPSRDTVGSLKGRLNESSRLEQEYKKLKE